MNNFIVHIKTMGGKMLLEGGKTHLYTFFQVQVISETTNFFPAECSRLEEALKQALTNANIDWVPGTEIAWHNKQPIKLVFVSEDHN